jgi:hypothetical protein
VVLRGANGRAGGSLVFILRMVGVGQVQDVLGGEIETLKRPASGEILQIIV